MNKCTIRVIGRAMRKRRISMAKFGMQFFKPTEKFNGNWSVLEHKSREWEKMYRERWSHDKVVRTTHGVNCTGSCSWKVFVKNGVITW